MLIFVQPVLISYTCWLFWLKTLLEKFHDGCLEDKDILSVKVKWTLDNLLKVGEGNKVWGCGWELRKHDGSSKFKVPADGSLKGSVIQVLKEGRSQIFVTPVKSRR